MNRKRFLLNYAIFLIIPTKNIIQKFYNIFVKTNKLDKHQ